MDWGRPRVRLLLIAGMGILWMAATIGRLAYLQLFEYGDYLGRAEKQQQRVVTISPRRGSIYDRNMHELAMSVMVDSCFAVPGEVKDPDMAARLISRVVNVSPDEIAARIASEPNFAWVARKITSEQADRIRRMNLKGIYFVKEPKSFFPKGVLAAEDLGWTDMDEKGGGGIESALDSQIRGRPGRMMVMTDAHRRWFEGSEQSAQAGAKVVLTLDQNIQFIIEKALAQAMATTHAKAGSVIVEDPSTGELLGVASWPTFNPNTPGDSPADARRNLAISSIYEPGSVFKLITVSGAIDQGITNPDEVIDCQMGHIEIAGHRIRDHKPFGLLSVREILAKSSDVGAIKLGLRLGAPKFYDYIRAFGVGSPTGVELPGDQKGILHPLNNWSAISIGSISMGQEVGVTAIQLVSAMNTIANGGVWVRPHIVRTVGNTTPVTPANFQETRHVISATTAATMRAMLEGVVLPGGTGKNARLDGYTAAGKTGTAQKIDPSTGHYSPSQYVASFVGFAPINNPAVTILVTLDSPVGPHEGGQVSAPVFKIVAEQVLAYMNVPQDEAPSPRIPRASYGTSSDANDSDVSDFDPVQTESTADAESVITPPSSTAETPAQTVALSEGDGITVPQLGGKTVREAIVELGKLGLTPALVGSGVALEESPEAGSIVRRGARITVRFGRAAPTDTKRSGDSRKPVPIQRNGTVAGVNGDLRQ